MSVPPSPPGGWQPGPHPPQPQPQWGAPSQQMPPGYGTPPGYGAPPHMIGGPTVQLPGVQPFRPGPYQTAPPGYPPGNAAPRRRPWLKPTLIAAVVAAVVGGGIGIASAAGAFGTVFDKQAMERDIPSVLGKYYPHKTGEIGTVACPADQPTTPGHKFTCTVVVGKDIKTVDIAVGQNTEYTVSMPR